MLQAANFCTVQYHCFECLRLIILMQGAESNLGQLGVRENRQMEAELSGWTPNQRETGVKLGYLRASVRARPFRRARVAR